MSPGAKLVTKRKTRRKTRRPLIDSNSNSFAGYEHHDNSNDDAKIVDCHDVMMMILYDIALDNSK